MIDVISALGGSGVAGTVIYIAVRKGLVTSGACKGCRTTLESEQEKRDIQIKAHKDMVDLQMESGKRQFVEIKDGMKENNTILGQLRDAVNVLIGKHESGNGNGGT